MRNTKTIVAAWKPILDGARAQIAWQAVWDVARGLEQVETLPGFEPSLARGSAGLALFYGYLAKTTERQKALALCHRFMDLAGAQLQEQPLGAHLFGGYPGVGWVATHLRDLLDPAAPDPATEVDEALCALLDREHWTESYDLIEGLVGIGVYGRERLTSGRGREILARVIQRLDGLALRTEQGLAWFTPPEHIPEWIREKAPRGLWNLGLAHGNPGVLALLGLALRANVEVDRARRLLHQGMAWLTAQRNPEGSMGWFSNTLGEGQEPYDRSSRVAWCYGDLGLAAALMQAGRHAGVPSWETQFLAIARDAAARPRSSTNVLDSGVCHGTAGNALIFLRLYHATQEEGFRRAALDYLDWTLELRDSKGAFGGFPQAYVKDDQTWAMKYTAGLLEGNAGVALVLLAALTDRAPDWDRHLLVALEPIP